MKRLCDDLRSFSSRTRIICAFVIALALLVLGLSVMRIIQTPTQGQFMLLAFATITAFFTGPRPVRLPGTKTVVSVLGGDYFPVGDLARPLPGCGAGHG